ncbi:MAG: PUR family DNA/RNA-binding protein [Bacteroidales bacterium]|nr:PUR family DNA/RNA-binding protein [Bacteroidales bacterium]
MYFEDYDNAGPQERNGDDVFSKPVRAGKRTYFFDVKATKGNDYYLTITESKRRIERDGRYVYDKHKIFLYKEDFEKFSEGLEEVIKFIKERCPVTETPSYEERGEKLNTKTEEAPSVPNSFTDVNFEEL